MRTKIAVVAAATLPLFLGGVGARAGEPGFRTPSTDRAQQTQALLTRAAQALVAAAPGSGKQQIESLWLFPTADEETVFAQYTVVGGQTLSQEHLELLRMSGDRIVQQQDLVRVGTTAPSQSAQTDGGLDWTASIGTGHAASAAAPAVTTHGSPASAHWSALIGTGQVGQRATPSSRTPANARVSAVGPEVHWTSKIGTGHAADANTGAQDGGLRLTTRAASNRS